MPNESCLAGRQIIKIRNVFVNNMSTDIKVSKPRISKIIQWGESLASWLGNLGKKVLTNVAIDNLLVLVPNLASNEDMNDIIGIMNEDINDIFGIIKSWDDSNVLINAIMETVKHEIRKTKRRISWDFVSTFSRFVSATRDFFSSTRCKRKRS